MACFAHSRKWSFTKGFTIPSPSHTFILNTTNGSLITLPYLLQWFPFEHSISSSFVVYQWPSGIYSVTFIYSFLFQRCCVVLSYLNSSLALHLWSHCVQTPVCCTVSCTICCFLLSPNSSSLFTSPTTPPAHTSLPAPSLPPPLRLGSNSTCKWWLALILTCLLYWMARLCHTAQCSWRHSSEIYSKVLGCWNVLSLTWRHLHCHGLVKPVHVAHRFIKMLWIICKYYLRQVCFPLPGVSNAVGCGCVSDCCRLWGCGPGFREWGFL